MGVLCYPFGRLPQTRPRRCCRLLIFIVALFVGSAFAPAACAAAPALVSEPTSTGDRHVLVIDRDNWKLYELYSAFPVNGGTSWNAAWGAGLCFHLDRKGAGGGRGGE